MNSEMFKLIYQAITQGLIIGFCTAALIGPVNFLAIRRGIMGGFQKTFGVGAGAAFVDACCAWVVFAGLSKVGFTGALKFILWGLCAIFLLYLAYSMLTDIRDNPENMDNPKLLKQVQWLDHSFVMGFLLAATNPFTLIYWIGMVGTLRLSMQIPPNLDIAGGAATSFFSAVLVSELIWFSCLGMGVHYSRNLFNRKALKIITWSCGLFLLFYYFFMATKVVMNLVHTGGAPFMPH
jgi:L-lysine exporter family protein LysE/ArgO